MTASMYRQGDVLLIRLNHNPIPALTQVVHSAGRVILALGEATGHAHAIHSPLSELFEDRDGTRYLVVAGPCELRHEEHDSIPLTEGVYEVRLQREYAPETASYSKIVRD